MHQFLKFINFDLTLCMFRAVFTTIIRSSRLYIQQQAYVKQILLPAFLGLYVFRKVFLSIIRSTRLYIYLLLYVQS
jgi:hypothetical protein